MQQLCADMSKPTEYVVELADLEAPGGWRVVSVHTGARSAIDEASAHYPEAARLCGIPNIWSMVRLRNVGAS